MKKYAFHPVLFSIFPILALLANNIDQVSLDVAVRPLVISVGFALVLLGAIRLLLKGWQRAALLTTWLLVLFFSYGHIYQLLRQVELGNLSLGRHRLLLPVYAVVAVLVAWWLLRRRAEVKQLTFILNVVGLVLVVVPGVQIVSYTAQQAGSQQAAERIFGDVETLNPPPDQPLPDVYYIILDTYTRADALSQEYGFDNQPFLSELQRMGFYVADCGRSNYGETFGSLTSSLNFDYLPTLLERLEEAGLSGGDLRGLLEHNRVRYQLEQLGYTVVAFDTHYDWSRWPSADIYLSLSTDARFLQQLDPFEAMLIKSTLGLVITDAQYKLQMAHLDAALGGVNFPYQGFAENQLFILDQMSRMGDLDGPKLVFAHILIPHVPRVFGPDGEIVTDPGYYGGDLAGAINEDYNIRGYLNEIQFINSRMLDILSTIVETSEVEPIIVLQGDTGLGGTNKYQILNALYLPGGQTDGLYPSITPVNTFRVIFNTFFGADLDLLPDLSYDGNEVIPETSSACLP